LPHTVVSIQTIRYWVAYVALNGSENYPHFIWVLVVSGFAGTGLGGRSRPPDQNFRPPSPGVVLIQWGVLGFRNPPRQIEHWVYCDCTGGLLCPEENWRDRHHCY